MCKDDREDGLQTVIAHSKAQNRHCLTGDAAAFGCFLHDKWTIAGTTGVSDSFCVLNSL